MTIITAIQNSARKLNRLRRMVALYWFFHSLMAMVAALALMGVVVPALAHSSYTTELLRQFDMAWLMEITRFNRAVAGSVIAVVLMSVFIAMLGAVYLSGGAVRFLVREQWGYHIGDFHEGCGLLFWRYLRLMLYSLFFYGIVMAINGILAKVISKVWGEGMEAAPATMAGWGRTVLLVLLLGLVGTAMDYAKVRLAVDGSRKSLRAAFGSFFLVLRNPGRTMGTWLVLSLFWALFLAIYLPVANAVQAATMSSILLLIVWQQVYVLCRVWLRMMSWGAAAEWDPTLRPRRFEPEEPALVPAVAAAEPPTMEAGAEADLPATDTPEEPAV
jgi:hypothetical protein